MSMSNGISIKVINIDKFLHVTSYCMFVDLGLLIKTGAPQLMSDYGSERNISINLELYCWYSMFC